MEDLVGTIVLFLVFGYGIYCASFPELALKQMLDHDKVFNPLEFLNKNIKRDTKFDVFMCRVVGIFLVVLALFIFYKIVFG
jgi:hypothetical protein